MRTALTIAGSDSGGGAGIQADLKTFAALGVFGTSAIVALTAQNTERVRRVFEIPPDMVLAQIDAVADDMRIDAVKTGMLASSAIVRAVAGAIAARGWTEVVVDPVMVAKSGDLLLAPEAVESVRLELLPRARIVTPNRPEAEVLSGRAVSNLAVG